MIRNCVCMELPGLDREPAYGRQEDRLSATGVNPLDLPTNQTDCHMVVKCSDKSGLLAHEPWTIVIIMAGQTSLCCHRDPLQPVR